MYGRNNEQNSLSDGYYEAARFTSEPLSGQAFKRLQDLLRSRDIGNLSVYRVLINMMYHVIVIGEQPSDRGMRRLQQILSVGEPVSLPNEVVSTLQKRRVQTRPW